MIKEYFKLTRRNMLRHKSFSILNIAGLALGFTACFLIALFIWDEYQFDKFFPEAKQTYRVYNQHTDNEGTEDIAVTYPMVATTLEQKFPEVVQTARIMMLPENKSLYEVNNKKMYLNRGIFVDSTFFKIFPLNFKFGSQKEALHQQGSIILSQEMSKKFFGDANPIGKQIVMDKTPLTITGVIQNNPKFHLQFNSIMPLSLAGIPEDRMQSWGWQQFYTYVKLKKGSNAKILEAKFQPVVQQKTRELREGSEPSTNKIILQPLEQVHLHSSNFIYDNAKRGNITYVRALTFIAIFILLIACFNFVNLSTAKSIQRAKEVGVRKTIGADKKQLIFQFISETIFLTAISLIFSILLSAVLLPWFNQITGKAIDYSVFANPRVLLIFISLTVLIGILAGFYPALILSNFKPVNVLKGSASGTNESGMAPMLRKGLVVLQFSMSILLMICAIVVFDQVNYLNSKDLGFNKGQIMFFPMRADNLFKNKDAFKEQLEQVSGVSSVSIGYGFPGDAVAGDGIKVQKNGQLVELSVTQLMVDYDYIETLGLKMVAGRKFSKEMGTDKNDAFIINETAVNSLGFETPEKALGKKLVWNVWNEINPDSIKEGRVIGVVKDFNYKSLYEKIEPTVLQIFPEAAWKVAIKLNSSHLKNSLYQIEKIWSTFSPDYPLEYKFLDENFEKMYESDEKLKTILGIFTGLAIFIGCLGLFGLAAFSAEKRKREIGIRKVLGASVESITMLLSKDFMKLVILALLIASPIAWYFMSKWLQDFAYRINLSWWIFMVAGLCAIAIALLTVGFHAVKAAIKNPTKNLRTE